MTPTPLKGIEALRMTSRLSQPLHQVLTQRGTASISNVTHNTTPQTTGADSSMTRQLTREQSTARNARTFRDKFTTLSAAAVAVTLVRTREPYRAIETLRDFAAGEKDMGFRVWTIADGWMTYDLKDPLKEPKTDAATAEVGMAIRSIKGVGGNDTFGNGVFVMMYPHKMITQSPVMMQIIKDYARKFPETMKRVVLLTTPGWSLPAELEDDVPILDFDVPALAELREVYQRVWQGVPEPRRPRFNDTEIDRIMSAGAGMTEHEFESGVSRAFVETRTQLPNVPADVIASKIAIVKTEAVKRSEVLEIMPSDKIENIGGLENLKSWIRKRARCFSQEAKDAGVEAPKGIALIGPPGTGKTASAKAIASVLGLTLIRFDVGKVFGSLVGQSEARVREALKMVEAMAPCVLMIDEVDKAFAGSTGGGGDGGVGTRVLGTMLTWMQETPAPVFMVVTANRTANMPTEFLRRGRLDEIFSVTVPHAGERLEVLKIHLRKRRVNPDEIADLDKAVEASEGYVSAELEAAVKDSVIEAFNSDQPVTGELIAQQVSQVRPIAVAFAEDFEKMKKWAEDNARPASLQVGQSEETPRARVRTRPVVGGTGRQVQI